MLGIDTSLNIILKCYDLRKCPADQAFNRTINEGKNSNGEIQWEQSKCRRFSHSTKTMNQFKIV